MPRMLSCAIAAALVVLVVSGNVSAQTFAGWFESRKQQLIEAAAPEAEALVDENSRSPLRQREAPASNTRSTSLVDGSAASDFVSVALSFLPVPPTSDASSTSGSSSSAGSGSFTVSAYSLLALANGTSLTDPEFYAEHTGARRFFFTLGTAASEMERDNTDRQASVVGFKYLAVNQRDLYAEQNLERIRQIQQDTSQRTLLSLRLRDEIERIIFVGLRGNVWVKCDGEMV